MRLAQDDNVVQALASDRSDQPFGKAILLRRVRCDRLRDWSGLPQPSSPDVRVQSALPRSGQRLAPTNRSQSPGQPECKTPRQHRSPSILSLAGWCVRIWYSPARKPGSIRPFACGSNAIFVACRAERFVAFYNRCGVTFYNRCGTRDQWINEAKGAIKRTRLSYGVERSNRYVLWVGSAVPAL